MRNLAALRFTCREALGSGVALIDCDNDGRLDLYLVNGAPIRIKSQAAIRIAIRCPAGIVSIRYFRGGARSLMQEMDA